MKKPILTVLVMSFALVLSAGANAQTKTTKKKAEDKAQDLAAKAKQFSMIGCLAKGTAAGSYMVTDVEKGAKNIGIVSSSANLAPHVGHRIEVTGVSVPEKEAEANKKVPKAETYMKVSSVRMISPTCP
jgi:hypothetical protein